MDASIVQKARVKFSHQMHFSNDRYTMSVWKGMNFGFLTILHAFFSSSQFRSSLVDNREVIGELKTISVENCIN